MSLPPPAAAGPDARAAAGTPTWSGHAHPTRTGPPPAYPFLAPPAHPGDLGRLGGYRVVGLLGQGGMGLVFRAEDPVLGRQVALKVMLPHAAAHPVERGRFLREARAAAAVEHDHVVPIFQVGEDRGTPFLAMPLLKGMPLGAALRAARPPLGELLRVGREVAEGLAAAHAMGLVHRDIKPGNVWLEGDRRRVKILDFGLARGVGGDPDPTLPAGPAAPLRLTQTGHVVGTPQYMSPEQAQGQPVDHRTDLFSLGVLLFQMATGALPFGGGSLEEVIVAVVFHTPPDPRTINPDLPPALAGLIGRLLAKHPDARPPTAAAVAAELAGIAATADPGTVALTLSPAAGTDPWSSITAAVVVVPPVPRRRRTKLRLAVWAAAGGVVMAGVAALAWLVIAATAPKAVLVVERAEPGEALTISRNGVVVRERTTDREMVLPPGDYTLELAGGNGERVLNTGKVSLARDARETVWVKGVKRDPPRPPPEMTEREAAEKLGAHASLWLRPTGSGGERDAHVPRGEPLPGWEFEIRRVQFTGPLTTADFRANLLPALRKRPALLFLQLHVPLTPGQVAEVGEILTAKRLLTFGLSGQWMTAAHLAEIATAFPNITELFAECEAWGDDEFRHLAKLKSLATIHLFGPANGPPARLSANGFARLADLPVSGAEFTNVGLTGSHFRVMTGWRLAFFGFEGRGLDEAGLVGLARSPVKSVAVTRGPAGDETAAALAALPGLQVATLLSTNVTDGGLRHLCRANRVYSLNLSGTKVTDAGLEHLPEMRSLQSVSFSGTKVTDGGLGYLRNCPRLSAVYLENTGVTAEGVAELSAARPDLTIRWNGGEVGPR